MKTKLFLCCIAFGLLGCSERAAFTPATWVDITPGTFQMGTPADEPCRETGDYQETLHTVTLTLAFAMSTTETTQGQFEAALGYNPSTWPSCGPNCPVDHVSWYEAAAYCNALSVREKLPACYACTGSGPTVVCGVTAGYAGGAFYDCPGYRLPTEAEWEGACRAGTQTSLFNGTVANCTSWDATANEVGWYQANAGLQLHRAGEKKGNAWGLYDLPGGVWEWVHDKLQDDLGSDPVTDPTGPPTGFSQMLRGGSIEVAAQFTRCGSRYNNQPPEQRLRNTGFRCVRSKPATR